MISIFEHLCPNCGRRISDERLKKKLPCSKCLKTKIEEKDFDKLIEKIYNSLKEEGTLKQYAEFYELEKELREFEKFFKNKIGNKLWSAQRTWARRVFKGESFTIIAPTGVGKTTLAAALSVWLSQVHNKKVYFIVPTTTLVLQTVEKIRFFGGDPIYFHSKMKKKEKEKFMEKLRNGEFEILVTTSQYLARNFDLLRNIKFDIIFVDDVDALLKASKNIDRILMLVGFNENDIQWAMDIIYLKSRIPYIKEKEKLEEIFEKINKFNEYIEKKRKSVGQIIMSSATARPRGKKPRLFRELLGFEIGESGGGLRNIEDLYILVEKEEEIFEKILEIVQKFGTGGLIFVAKDLGEEYVIKLRDYLKERGINCDSFLAGDKSEKLEKFANGEIDILIGVAHFYGLLVRGIDLPARVRYTIFFEAPRFKLRISDALYNPYFLLYFIDEILEIKKDQELKSLGDKIQKFLREASRGALQLVLRKLRGEEEIELTGRLEEFYNDVIKAREVVLKILEDKSILGMLKKAKSFYLEEDFVYFPDVNTYIQASGRCSRLFAGGLTKGASIVVTRNEKILRILERKLGWKYSEFEFKNYYEVNIDKLIEEIDKDRELVRKIQRGEIPPEFEDPVKSILFIVESPNKARTIANFFGKPSVRKRGKMRIYEVTTGKYMINLVATVGHVFDLVTQEGVHGVLNIDNKWIPVYNTIKKCKKCGETFNDDFEKCPKCGSEEIEDAIERIETIREFAKEVDLVLIATDPDSVDGKSKVLVKWNGEIIYTTIEELFDKLLEKEEFFIFRDHEYIKPRNLYVLGFKDGKIRFVKVNYLIRHFVKKPLYRIRTKTGKEIRVTGDHSLFTLKGIEIKEVKPTELSVGDFIIVPRIIRVKGNNNIVLDLLEYRDKLKITEVSNNLVRIGKSKAIPRYIVIDNVFMTFLGLWVGDGSFHKDRYVRISTKDKECLEIIKEVAKRFNANIYEEKDGVTVTIMSKPLYVIMKCILGLEHGAKKKKVPEIVFRASNNLVASFLKGLFSADGTVSKGEPNLYTTSRELVDGVCTLLLRLGIVPKVYRDDSGYRIFVHGKWIRIFKEKVGFLQDYKNKLILETKTSRTYLDIIPFGTLKGLVFHKEGFKSYAYAVYSSGRMGRERAITFASTYIKQEYLEKLTSILKSDIMFDEIVEIKREDFVGYVYDFDTESDNFVANNILCHNTEGEKIAWDIYNAISPYVKEIKRAEFHEVTERAILNAIENPRDIDLNLVKAQIVRRIEDRWLGFELSQLLMRYFKRKNISAGRVQTPVLKWVIDRYKERKEDLHYFFTVKTEDFEFTFDLPEVKDEVEANKIVEKIKEVEVKLTEEYEKEVNPLPPFETQTMISEASRILGWGANKTMQIAQNLFEMGLCLHPDTLIMLEDGRIAKIKDVVENKGGNLLGVENLKEKTSKVERYLKYRWNGDLIKIELENGHKIVCTPDHGLFIARNNYIGWASAKNIREGDYIAFIYNYNVKRRKEISLLELLKELDILDVNVIFKKDSKIFQKLVPIIKRRISTSTKYKYIKNRTLPLKYLVEWNINLKEAEKEIEYIYRRRARSKKIPIFKLDERFWYFVGLVLGDGSIKGSKVFVAETPLKRAEEIVKEIFPFLHVFRTCNQVGFSNSIIAEILRKLGAREGKLHPIIFSLKEEYINAMIAGYFDTDGCFSVMNDKGKPNFRFLLTSKRRDALEKISIYLYTIGIENRLRRDERTGIWSLIISNKNMDRFSEKIGKYLIIRRRKFIEGMKKYREAHKKRFSEDLVPKEVVTPIFIKGGKFAVLKAYGYDIWNWEKSERIPREKLKIALRFLENKEIIKKIIESPLTWVKVRRIERIRYNGYVYDFKTDIGNFFANGMLSHNCTYHRTDSIRVSPEGMGIAKRYISEKFGEEYYKGRIWGTGGAHECIRPTRPIDPNQLLELISEGLYPGITRDHIELYELIFRRFIASQMKPARVVYRKYKIRVPGIYEGELEVPFKIVDASWLLVYPTLEEKHIKAGKYKVISVESKLDSKIILFTEGSLVAEMKKRKIGRPSTYATIIQKIRKRKYVVGKYYLRPTPLGVRVADFLFKNYEALVSEERTRELEEKMDRIERGEVDHQKTLWELYNELRMFGFLKKFEKEFSKAHRNP